MSWYLDTKGPHPRYLLNLNERLELTLETACECLRGEDFDDGVPEVLEPRWACIDCTEGLRNTRRDPLALYALLERGNLTPAELSEVMFINRLAGWGVTWAWLPPGLDGRA